MKTFQAISLLLSLALMPNCATLASTVLLPGLTYYDSSEKLTGKLVFLHRHDYNQDTNSETAASIYEFDLSQKKLRTVTECPSGLFLASDQGNVFCVVYRPGDWFRSLDTNAFVYSDSTRQRRIVNLGSPPISTKIVDEHVFFEVEKTDSSQRIQTTGILDYDIASDQKRAVEFPDASKWQYQQYEGVLVVQGRTNIIQFHYNPVGTRLGDGKDYPEGFYTFDFSTGNILGPLKLMDSQYDRSHTYKALDGSYIFFTGPDGPAIGSKLVSSPWSDFETKFQDPRGRKIKVLKTFSETSVLGGGIYLLSQISPDGRYALVRRQEPTSPKSGMLPGFVNTYYLVDASNGKTQVLLKDETERKTNGSVPIVRWVGGAQ